MAMSCRLSRTALSPQLLHKPPIHPLQVVEVVVAQVLLRVAVRAEAVPEVAADHQVGAVAHLVVAVEEVAQVQDLHLVAHQE